MDRPDAGLFSHAPHADSGQQDCLAAGETWLVALWI
jgi:hypothetical protein